MRDIQELDKALAEADGRVREAEEARRDLTRQAVKFLVDSGYTELLKIDRTALHRMVDR